LFSEQPLTIPHKLSTFSNAYQ
jgi:thioredoxin 1